MNASPFLIFTVLVIATVVACHDKEGRASSPQRFKTTTTAETKQPVSPEPEKAQIRQKEEPASVPSTPAPPSPTPQASSSPKGKYRQNPEPPAPPKPLTTAELEAFDKRARAIAAKSAKLMELEKAGKLIGITLAEVEQLIGPPTSTEGQTVVYRLDTGFGGLEWKLEHREGKVIGATRLSMN